MTNPESSGHSGRGKVLSSCHVEEGSRRSRVPRDEYGKRWDVGTSRRRLYRFLQKWWFRRKRIGISPKKRTDFLRNQKKTLRFTWIMNINMFGKQMHWWCSLVVAGKRKWRCEIVAWVAASPFQLASGGQTSLEIFHGWCCGVWVPEGNDIPWEPNHCASLSLWEPNQTGFAPKRRFNVNNSWHHRTSMQVLPIITICSWQSFSVW